VGLGIHGEPGVDLIDFNGAKSVAEIVANAFRKGCKASGYALFSIIWFDNAA
jgi:hypothetical protein